MDDAERTRQGMTVRREVLGDAHVDRAVAAATPFTEPFQDFITRYAWGDIWSRPGLSRAERSLVTLAVPKLEERLTAAGITPEQIDSALEPSGYLGSADAFITAALDAHRSGEIPHG